MKQLKVITFYEPRFLNMEAGRIKQFIKQAENPKKLDFGIVQSLVIWQSNRIYNPRVEENPNPLYTYVAIGDERIKSKYQKGDTLLVSIEGVQDGIITWGEKRSYFGSTIIPSKINREAFIEITNVRLDTIENLSESDVIKQGFLDKKELIEYVIEDDLIEGDLLKSPIWVYDFKNVSSK